MPDAVMESKAWPFKLARQILARRESNGSTDSVVFETGYGPSGMPHIGTFGEVLRTTMVRNAFESISDIPTRLICFSDDMDGLRKVPDNVPNADMMADCMQMPLTKVPDPYGEHDSFADRNNAMLRRFLDRFEFDYEFISATEFYQYGRFNDTLMMALERYDDIMEIMLSNMGSERQANYSIFLPIHPETGRIMYVPMKNLDINEGTVTFDDESSREWTVPVIDGNVKLQWKPDFGARWAALGVDFEMFGKDHATNASIYDRICRILGHQPPEHFVYELFLDENGNKISKSDGNGVTMDEWMEYASTDSLAYFMYQKPQTAKRLHFDIIPKMMDEYHSQLRTYQSQDENARLNNPVHHIHNGNAPESGMAVPFAMLLNLASVTGATSSDMLWKFIQTYAPDADPSIHRDLDEAVGFALNYCRDYVLPDRNHRLPTDNEREAMNELTTRLKKCRMHGMDEEALQSIVYDVGRDRFDPLREWFTALYEVLLGASQGPRFGGFIALIGVDETINLIESALNGDLVNQQG